MAISLQSVQQPQTIHSVNPGRGIRSQIKQDVQSLSTALQSGDLQTAQKSYGDLQKLLQGNGSISQASTKTTPSGPLGAIKADFQQLGTDLQSGDLAAAQKDYAQLATDSSKIVEQPQGGPQRAGGHHENHGPPPPPDNDGDSFESNGSSGTNVTTNPGSTSSTSLSAYQFQLSATFTGTGNPSDTSPFAQVKTDFLALSKDLQSGNSDSAQKDYAQLLKDAQSLGGSSNSTGGAAYQYSLSSLFESASATSGNASATQSTSLFEESLQTTAPNTNPKQTPPAAVYQASSQASLYQSVSVVA